MQTSKEAPTVHAAPQAPGDTLVTGLKYQWRMKHSDNDTIRSIAYRHNLSLPIAHVLYGRGYQDEAAIRSFLFTSFEQDVHCPSGLRGMEPAVKRILLAIERKEKILIFGDYDVDGITSSSLALSALLPLGAKINFFLPNRKVDGYGLSKKAVIRAHQNGYSLIITVDNGITAHEAAQEAKARGLDLIITDHHRQHGELPPALAVINPNQFDCTYAFKHLAGVGVTFKLVTMIYKELGLGALPEKTYELLLLGTVADVVPLLGENRYWVRHGLHTINKQRSNAMITLAQNSNLTKALYNSLDIGFMIAPQLNALGRLSDPRDAVKFMLSSNLDDVLKIGQVLKDVNEERKRVDRGIYDEIERSIINKQIDIDNEYVIVAASRNWPAGVIGLVAGKLMHSYGRPTLLFHLDDRDGLAKGSCRSIPEFNIFDALSEQQHLLLSFGGHSFAAGLKLKQELLPALKEGIAASVAAQLTLEQLQPKITVDAPLQLTDITYKLLSDLEQLEPFGNANPQPLFMINDVTLLKPPQLLKDKHVKCMVFSQGIIKPVMFFYRPDLMPVFQQLGDKAFTLAAHVSKNEWNGNASIDLHGVDVAVQ